jgi:hypothetical protein
MRAVRELLRLLSRSPLADQNITNEELAQHYRKKRKLENHNGERKPPRCESGKLSAT